LKNKFTILGCGSSLGSPWITGHWGYCNKKNKKNIRTRSCAHFYYKNISILIDTSPDLKNQFYKNKIKEVDAVIYTHEHVDQTSGIFELRPFFWKNKKKINVYGSNKTMNELKNKYDFCFKEKNGYFPILKSNVIKNNFFIKKKGKKIKINSFDVQHGEIKATAYVFEKIAYLSDCNSIPSKFMHNLYDLNYLIIDCLKRKKHPSHFNYDEVLELIKILKPKKAILTNLHTDLDYDYLKKKLPKNIIPAFDGLSFNF
tara:strand:- start:141 stop:911 length:771 start_codon:yes stop_codon:yes gene_type:complete